MSHPIWPKADATTADQILGDVSAALSWLRARYPEAAIHLVGFCFGGHAAFLAATLPGVAQVFDFYGASVSRMRPGGGEPAFSLLPEDQAWLTCVFGTADPLVPAEDREVIGDALRRADPTGQSLRCVECACCLVTSFWFSPGGRPPWQQWVLVVPGWCARPCWRHALFPPSSPAASSWG